MHDLSLYLLEILENSVRAEATRVEIDLTIDQAEDVVRLRVDDNGKGLSTSPQRTLDPFYTTKPGKKTGLGLSLLKADAEMTGGHLEIGPSPLGGARVDVCLGLTHIDRPPLGDVATTIAVTALTNRSVTFAVSLSGDRFDPPLSRASPSEAAHRLMAYAEGP